MVFRTPSARLRCEPRVAQVYPPIRPQISWKDPNLGLEQQWGSAIVTTCFGVRKNEEAWNPGNFGCRGLLVYGPRHCEEPQATRQPRAALDCFATLAMTAKDSSA